MVELIKTRHQFINAALSLLYLVSFASSAAVTLENRSDTALTQTQGEARLIPNGITASSTGGCTTKIISTCTSYSGILSGTVDGVITLKNASGVSSLVITGGTEVGHASSTYSHANGYKVNTRHSNTLDSYIKGHFIQPSDPSDGYPRWQAASGSIYCDEGTHRDNLFY